MLSWLCFVYRGTMDGTPEQTLASKGGGGNPAPTSAEEGAPRPTKWPRLELTPSPGAVGSSDIGVVSGNGGPGPLSSVLKIFVVRSEPNYAQPWQKRPQRSATGSALVACSERRWILTNAHVVAFAVTVHVRRPGNARKWPARVLCHGHICDLALVTVDDDAFWEGLRPVTFVGVPELQDTMLVTGYPLGGDSLSVTKGIVSRVTMHRYNHSHVKMLAIQIDAAINPGNSGGPAFADLSKGLVAGVTFSKISSADNIGYIIPVPVVKHFLTEWEQHGHYRGVCSLGFRFQDMENQHLRQFFKMRPEHGGSLVWKIDPLSPASRLAKVKDVILSVDGVPIADDGTIEYRGEERLEFTHRVRRHHVGEEVVLRVLRDGEEKELRFLLESCVSLVPVLHSTGCSPSYFVVGGLVFLPLTIPLLEHAYGRADWRKLTPMPILACLDDYKNFEDEQVVVLFQVLASQVNFGYKFQTVRCEKFNDLELRNLAHLAELVDACKEEYMRFQIDGGKCVILDRVAAVEHGPEILEQHNIATDRSADLHALVKAAA